MPSLVMEHLSASEVHWWSQAPGLTWTSPGPGWTCPTLACSLALSLHPLELKLGRSYPHHAFSCNGAPHCLRGTLVVSSTWLTWSFPGPGWTCPTLACSLALSLHPLQLKLGHSYLHHAFSCKGACQCLRGTLVVSSTWAHLDHLPWSWLDLPNFGLLPSSVTASA